MLLEEVMKKLTKLLVFALTLIFAHCASNTAEEQKSEGESGAPTPTQTIATCTVGTNLVGSCKVN